MRRRRVCVLLLADQQFRTRPLPLITGNDFRGCPFRHDVLPALAKTEKDAIYTVKQPEW
jgi:hypothetical protein